MNIPKAAGYLSMEERKELLTKNDWKALWMVFKPFIIMAITFTVVYLFPNVLTILIALFIIGGQQLACSVTMHDAGHHALFTNTKVNDFMGKWLGGAPVMNDMLRYRSYHFIHHLHTGMEEDPDLFLTRGYPTSRKSMIRKLTRDLTGQTGIKQTIGLWMMHLNYLEYNLGGKTVRVDQSNRSWSAFFKTLWKHGHAPILFYGLLFLLFWVLGTPWLFLLWIVAYWTTFNFSVRIRSMAEHSMLEQTTDPNRNTRTTYANWLERLLFAPNHVNYHLEHHMIMAVPPYNLPKMHRLLKQRGYFKKGVLENGYWAVLKMAMSA